MKPIVKCKKIILAVLLFMGVNAFAQLQVQTTILPPYSPYLSDYVNYQNKIVLNVINPTQQTYQARLQGTIKGNGIQIAIPTNFKPANALTVIPGANKFTGNQLSPYFEESSLQVSGITMNEIVLGNGLPEGTYTACFWLVDYNSGQALSPVNSGCAVIKITHFEVPKIISPACNAEVTAMNPQNMVFNWTVPAGVNPADVEYEFTMVEMWPQNINPNQALDVATEPFFFKKVVPFNNLIYTLADPMLELGKKYAWRVRARAKPGKQVNFKNNGISFACAFTYKEGQQNQQPPPPPQDDMNCIADCNHPMPNNNSPYSPQVNDEISIGKFVMTIKTINGNSGTGSIKIPFLNANVLVDFSNLQVNTDKQAFGNSKAVAKIDNQNIVDQAMANNPDGEIQMAKNKFDQLKNYISQGNKYVSKFNPEMQPTGVPFAIDNNGFDLNILGIIFTPQKAFINTLFGYEIADAIDNNFVDFSQKGICIRPNGYGVQPQLELKNDKTVKISNNAEIVFKKQNTKVQMGCDGIKSVTITGEYLFSRQRILPVNGGKVVEGNQRVKAEFSTTLNQGLDWIADATLSPSTFTVPDARDFIFTASGISIDMSETDNPQNVLFHNNHPKKNGFNKDWKGVFINQIAVQLPEGFNKSGNNISFNAQKLLIDKTGFWGNISAQNIVSLGDGDVGNWSFSIANLGLNIEASSLTGGSMMGEIVLPIAETGLGYTAIIQKGNQGVDFEFEVETQSDIDINMWLAKISLLPGSKINILKEQNKVTPSALLNGEISIGFSSSPDNKTNLSNLNIDGIKFQELSIKGGGQKPTINLQFVSLNMQPNKDKSFGMNRFPINLTGLSYDNGVNPGISFAIKVNLTKGTNGIEAETALKIKSKWEPGIKRFKYDGIDLQEVQVDAELGIMKIKGGIVLYKSDPVYGTGFNGDLNVTLKFAQVAIRGILQVGKIGNDDPLVENSNNYRYFMVDLSAKWGVGGLPIPGVGAVAFYGFGGGLYRNMTRDAVAQLTNAQIPDVKNPKVSKAGQTASGIKYTPEFGKFGLMASVTLGTTGDPTSFNCDLKLTVEFNTIDFGVTKVIFDGNGYLMGRMTHRGEELVKIGVLIVTDFDEPMFHASIDIEGGFNKAGLQAEFSAAFNMHFSPSQWYIKFGEWTNDDEPWYDKSRIQADISLGNQVLGASLNFNAFFMMGSNIGELPRSPLKVRQALGLEGKSEPKMGETAVYSGTAFAMGAGIKFDANVNFFVFYADIEFILGANILLAKSTASCNGTMDYGINGWYAKGLAYAYLDGDAGLRLKMWGFEGKFSLLQVNAAAQMRAEMPNPNWIKGDFAISGSILNGMISVNTRFSMEVGKKCQWGDGAADELPIISELLPEANETVSVFVAPQAAFNFRMDEQFTIVDFSKKKKGETRVFRTSVVSVQLLDGNKVVDGGFIMNSARNGLTYRPNEEIKGETTYTFKVVCRAQERVNGNWINRKLETKTTKFKTGPRPDYVDHENVVMSYPQRGQRYFLPKDAQKGNIKVFSPQCDVIQLKEDEYFTYDYKLVFTALDKSHPPFGLPFTCEGHDFEYWMPQNLKKETVYEVKMVRTAKPKNVKENFNKNTEYVYKNEKGQVIDNPILSGNQVKNIPPNMMQLPNNMQQQPNNQGNMGYGGGIQLQGAKGSGNNSGGGNMGLGGGMQLKGPAAANNKLMVRHNTVKNEQILNASEEKELFVYYFRTSKHQTAEEKYGTNYKFHSVAGHQQYTGQVTFMSGAKHDLKYTTYFPLLQGLENMDEFDAYGYTTKQNIKVYPLARPLAVWGGNSYFNTINSEIYNRKYKNQGARTSNQLKQNRHAGNSNFFGLTDQLFSRTPIEGIKVWHPDTEGPINIGANQSIMKPMGRLTNQEIAMAKNGHKITESNSKNPVLPLNFYMPSVILGDAVFIYGIHRNKCWSQYSGSNNRNKCRDEECRPLLGGSYFKHGVENPNPWNFTLNRTYTIKLTYGYFGNTPFTKDLNIKL